jgi:hypothetical protein
MSFWDNVLQPTPAMLLPPPENTPYDNVLGTTTGLDPSINDAGAEAVHPSLSPDPNSPDSLTQTAGKPAGFDLPPDQLSPDVFARWHTAYQKEYINQHKDANGFVTIGAGTDTIHATLSAAQDKVFILEALQKVDFATMALADQTRIAAADQDFKAADPNYHDALTRLGLTADPNVVDGPNSLLQKTIDAINGNEDPPSTDIKDTAQFVSPADKAIFLEELSNIRKRITGMGVFSSTDINAAVQAIRDRFHRVAVFAKSLSPGNAETPAFDDPNQTRNVISLDNNAAIIRGLQSFMNAEKQILAADNASSQIANTGTLEGLTKHLDAPNLVAAFQLSANLKDQAINAGDTEEINQINELLKTYNAIQELINRTIAEMDASDNKQKKGLLGFHDHDNINNNTGVEPNTDDGSGNGTTIPIHSTIEELKNQLSPEQLKVISMFEDVLGGIASPIEDLLGIKRPNDFDFYDNDGKTLNYFPKATWDEWSAILGNTVQQISQENQLKFNDINSLEKERTSHFQSATNALTKALDITSSIGRNLA